MTREQAGRLTPGQELHYTGRAPCARHVGPRGGITVRVTRVRVSGRVQTWKTRPDDVRVPVKYGLYESGAIERHNLGNWHLASDCPLDTPTPAAHNPGTCLPLCDTCAEMLDGAP